MDTKGSGQLAMFKAGYKTGSNVDRGRPDWDGAGPRPITWSAWYPAIDAAIEFERLVGPPRAPIFTMGAVAENAELNHRHDRWPVVLLSHGTGGSADTLGWLGRRLASSGYVALAVNHHGNTGIEPYRAEGFACWWERSRDLSVLLDQLSTAGEFAARLDLKCVFAAGFSLGAHSALALLGTTTKIDLFLSWLGTQEVQRGPREFPDIAERIPRLMEKSQTFRDSWARQSNEYRDERVRAVFAMAPPATVRGFTTDSLLENSIPVQIMVGASDQEAPPKSGAIWLQERMTNSQLTILDAPTGHYAFLNEATKHGRRTLPDICVDANGVDRRAIHDRAANAAIALFRSQPEGETR